MHGTHPLWKNRIGHIAKCSSRTAYRNHFKHSSKTFSEEPPKNCSKKKFRIFTWMRFLQKCHPSYIHPHNYFWSSLRKYLVRFVQWSIHCTFLLMLLSRHFCNTFYQRLRHKFVREFHKICFSNFAIDSCKNGLRNELHKDLLQMFL